ncbi:hypothetical protein [Paenibacillus flagellatus]|uniref:DUF2642 domain-containing protein n=1 Tax=Paenibacillus flagellatus TaxID=2211139 RepID=A0A2V5KQG1_9BACL|nr:hypothetical protein [Paenibacillus flagellatus]PYI53557.1 hypothetical protein DLM86_17510 [Paenibacillus flagellatus]
MDFSDALASYAGKIVEVFLPNEFLVGRLISVAAGIVTMEVANTTYTSPARLATLFTDNITFVRVRAAG